MDYLTELDKANFEYHRKNPELIISTSAWTTIAICGHCLQEVPLDDPCLVGASGVAYSNECLHCGNIGGWINEKDGYGSRTFPLLHMKYRKRFHVTREVKRWLAPPIRTGFWEFQEIPHPYPLETKELYYARMDLKKQKRAPSKENNISESTLQLDSPVL